MCGGGTRNRRLTEVRWSANTAGPRKKHVAVISDRFGVALVLHDPDNAWPRRAPEVRRAARKAWLAARRHEVAFRATRGVCKVLGHRPDPIEPWCCVRCCCSMES